MPPAAASNFMQSPLSLFRPNPEALVRQIQDLPGAPKVLHQLQKLAASPDSTLGEVVELIVLEPGLAARVVRMSNSTQFGGEGRVNDLMEAIQRVGLGGVQELVTYALASQLIGHPLKAYGLDAEAIWFRSVACALAAGSLAEASNADRAEAYTAGLLHGIGLMVIDRYVAQCKSNHHFTSSQYPVDFAPAEFNYLGYSHAEAGAALLDLWGFSAPIVEAVRFQIRPEAAGEHRQLAMILATARWARSLFCVPEEKIPELPEKQWLEEACIEIEDFGAWLDAVRRGYNTARHELKLK